MTIKSKTRYKRTEAIDFLECSRPGGPWVLTAIVPDGRTITETVSDHRKACKFIDEQNNLGRNIYYSINPTKTAMRKKSEKEDIEAVEYLHVDIDPRKDETSEQFIERIKPIIDEFPIEPTIIVQSGNGLNLLWRLKTPYKVATVPQAEAEIETLTHALAVALSGDAVDNIDRIFRVPGTTNYPNAKKRSAGRTECEARLVHTKDIAYDLEDFADLKAAAPDDNADDFWPGQKDPSGSGYLFGFFRDCKRRRGLTFEEALQELYDGKARGRAEGYAREQTETHLRGEWDKITIVGAGPKPAPQKAYVLVNAADVVPRPLQWVWKGHLLRSAQEIMTGIKGMGKSQIQCSLVACATTGRSWPNGEKGRAPGNVIMVTAEDVLDSVLVPRLILAGADLKRINFLDAIKQDDTNRMFMLGEDVKQLEQMIRDIGDVCLVCIDPITAFMGKVNSSSPTDVRSQLGPLAKLAERCEVAISTITHPPKNTTQRAIDSFIGSQSFLAAARIGHLCVPEMKMNESGQPVPTGRSLFTTVASNHKKLATIAYRIEENMMPPSALNKLSPAETARYYADYNEDGGVPYIEWLKEVDITSDEALSAASHKTPPQTDHIDDFLRDVLKDGPLLANEAVAKGHKMGFSRDQLKRAKKRLGVKTGKSGMVDGEWTWKLAR